METLNLKYRLSNEKLFYRRNLEKYAGKWENMHNIKQNAIQSKLHM